MRIGPHGALPHISLHLPTSPYISLYLPISPYISPHLPTSPYISLHLPTSPYISPHLPTSPYICLFPGAWLPAQLTRVPFNVEFTIHRFAEFMMLMVGETVLQLVLA